MPNAWLEVSQDGTVKIWCGKSEIGQGVRTALPMIVAEELSCDWRRVQVVQADLDPKYGDQLTGGSLSVRTSYDNLRKAGAAAREMLISAAAREWYVERSACRAENGSVIHLSTQKRFLYAQLVTLAAGISPPNDPPLKNPSDFKLIGKPSRRTDSFAKVTGAAKFGLDTRLPGMFIASVVRSPVYGGTPSELCSPCPRGVRSEVRPSDASIRRDLRARQPQLLLRWRGCCRRFDLGRRAGAKTSQGRME
ncbi:MAG: hypothetical protein DMG46_04765 [Acidobacteria bacterium]|nr:MAG: hypothetical protein DMG46_04765 [Acidobacteriota bacterium]